MFGLDLVGKDDVADVEICALNAVRSVPPSDKRSSRLLTVLVPAYDEAGTARELLDRVLAAPYD